MIEQLAQTITAKWWTFLLRGLFALALAVFVLMQPAMTVVALVYIVAAYFIATGIVAIIAGISTTGTGHWWLLILMGAMQAALGIVMLSKPGMGPLALAYLVATWAIFTGVSEIGTATALQNHLPNYGWWVFLGALSLAMGWYIIFRPELGVIALVYTIGFYALLAAVAMFVIAFRLKGAAQPTSRAPAV